MKLSPLLAITVALLAQSPARKTTPPDPGGYGTLTFDDEFNGGQLDLSLWSPHDPWNQTRDRQLQAYTPDSIRVPLEGNDVEAGRKVRAREGVAKRTACLIRTPVVRE